MAFESGLMWGKSKASENFETWILVKWCWLEHYL